MEWKGSSRMAATMRNHKYVDYILMMYVSYCEVGDWRKGVEAS